MDLSHAGEFHSLSYHRPHPGIQSCDQVNSLIWHLPQPYSLTVLIAASLGLRVEEIIPLQWETLTRMHEP